MATFFRKSLPYFFLSCLLCLARGIRWCSVRGTVLRPQSSHDSDTDDLLQHSLNVLPLVLALCYAHRSADKRSNLALLPQPDELLVCRDDGFEKLPQFSGVRWWCFWGFFNNRFNHYFRRCPHGNGKIVIDPPSRRRDSLTS